MADNVVGIIERINASSNLYNIASTAYGYCETAAATAEKAVAIPGFKYINGVTIHVRFKYVNSADNPSLNVNSEGAWPMMLYGTTPMGKTSETNGWQADAVISFTFVDVDSTHKYWYRDQGYNTNTTYTVKDTYSGTDGNPISGKGVKAALETLDVSNISGFGADKTLSALSETDGKISASFQSIQITESQVTNLTTHLGQKAPIASPTFTGTVTLPGAPTSDLHAATKKYVDDKTAGLSGAMHFKGTTTTAMTDGRTTAAVTIGGNSYTPSAGDVVIYSDSEFVWTGSVWERLGRDSSWALDSAVIKKSEFTAVGQLIYGTGSGTYNFLAGNTAASEKVLIMKGTGSAAAAPSWATLEISPSKTKAVTAVAYTANTGSWTTLNKGSGVSISGVSTAGTPTDATVTDAVLVITKGTATTKATAVTVPKLNDLSVTDGTWPTLNVTKNTDFLTGASITYT